MPSLQHDAPPILKLPRPDLDLEKPFVCSEGKLGKAASATGISDNLGLEFRKPDAEPLPGQPQVQVPKKPTAQLVAKSLDASELVPTTTPLREHSWNILDSDEKAIESSSYKVDAGDTASASPKPLMRMPAHAEKKAPEATRPRQMPQIKFPLLQAKLTPDPLAEVLDWLGSADLDQRYKNDLTPNVGAKAMSLEDGPDSRDLHRGFSAELNNSAEPDGAAPARQAVRSGVPRVVPPLGRKKLDAQCLQPAATCADTRRDDPTLADRMDQEDEEWLHRQQRTGTVGRLAMYAADQSPSQDIVLRGGMDHPVVVAAVRESGPAASAGVKAGDRLVSIDGKKELRGRSVEAVWSLIQPPVMLVFLGFVGKLQAEVRLSSSDQSCGLSSRNDVVTGLADDPFQVEEEKVFKPGLASLFLVVGQSNYSCSAEADPLFELRHCEATQLLIQARNASLAASSSHRIGASIVVDKRRQLAPDKLDGDHGPAEDGTQGQDVDALLGEFSPPRLSRQPLTPRTPITPRLTPREGPLGSPRQLRAPMAAEKARKASLL